jgi:Kdo2-lipid IVA lauroyltransferase/acyltransferase
VIAVALEGLAAVVARLPFRWLRALGLPLAWLVGSCLRIRRAHVEASLERAGDTEPQKSARAMYRALGANVMELLWLSRRPDAMREICSLDPGSRTVLERARSKGRGIVLAASHTGNWELAACAMARELDLTVIVKPIATQGVDAFMTRARRAHGLGLTLPQGALQPAREVLARGGSVAMLIDQVPEEESHGIPVEFLGARALADRAPAALAAATGAPLVVVAFRREEDGTHRIEVLDVLDPPARGRRAWTLEATRKATRALEGFVKRYPSQWLWMHRRWRAPRSADERNRKTGRREDLIGATQAS